MCFASVLVALAVVVLVTKGVVLLALAPLVPVYLTVQGYYLAASREMNRLSSVALAPIFSNFSETLAGLMTVRAFRKQVRRSFFPIFWVFGFGGFGGFFTSAPSLACGFNCVVRVVRG